MNWVTVRPNPLSLCICLCLSQNLIDQQCQGTVNQLWGFPILIRPPCQQQVTHRPQTGGGELLETCKEQTDRETEVGGKTGKANVSFIKQSFIKLSEIYYRVLGKSIWFYLRR